MCVEDNQHASKLFETSFTFQEANSHEIFMSDEGSFDGPNFATNLCNRLQQCSRKMRESPVVNSKPRPCLMRGNAALRESHPCTKTQTNLGHGVETVFQFEEECNEAIIDTGASRAVIGSNRLKGLIDSCGLAGKVKVTPSKVVFRFGNAGTLQSTSAVFFPRKTGGWIRVEVVPGQTPFLLSNSVLRSLKAVVDVDGGMLWFKGRNDGVPLKSCRKNLMSVDFGKILEIGKQGSKQEDEIHVATHGTENMNDTDMKHDENMPTHESAHHPVVLIGTTNVQNIEDHEEPCHVNEFCHSKHAAAICPTQSVNESSTRSTTDNADGTDGYQLSRPEAPIGDQSRIDHGQESADKQCGSAPASTGGEHSPRMGSICAAGREAPRKDLQRSLQGSELCVSTTKPQGSLTVGQEFPDVQSDSSSSRLHPVAEAPGTGISSHCGDAQSKRSETIPDSDQRRSESNQSGCGVPGMGQDQGGKIFQDRDRKEKGHVRIRERSSQSSNVNRTECRESSAAESQHRLAPARTGARDTRAQRWRSPVDEEVDKAVEYINSNAELSRLSADQEKLIHQELALKIAEVEDGLSKLPQRNAALKNQPNLVSPNNSRHSHSRPSDLLEVYCGPTSQITHHVSKRGGRAMRFTCDDGDLGTCEGVQKLWLWIYLYETRL